MQVSAEPSNRKPEAPSPGGEDGALCKHFVEGNPEKKCFPSIRRDKAVSVFLSRRESLYFAQETGNGPHSSHSGPNLTHSRVSSEAPERSGILSVCLSSLISAAASTGGGCYKPSSV